VKEDERNSVSYKRSLLIGTLLGDAYTRKIVLKNSALRAEIIISHSEKQKDLVYWKSEEFSRTFNIKLNPKERNGISSFSFRKGKRLRVVHDWFHKGGKKFITDKIRFMDHPIGLAILLCDDGSIRKRKKKHKDGMVYYLKPSITIATHCFTEIEVNIFLKHLDEFWGIKGYINPERRWIKGVKKEYNRVNFNSENSEKMWTLVKNWIPDIPSMRSKFSFAIERFGNLTERT